MKNKDIESIKKLVKTALIKNKSAREDDHLLYVEVAYLIDPSLVNVNFKQNFMNAKENGLPPFESVSRARRKVQEKHPELKGSIENQTGRAIKQVEFEEYSRGVI